MSFLSGHTKKVSVYGRKAEVRIVNRHNAFTSLENDENDPYGFFKTQSKPKATYGRSRASVISSLFSETIESDKEPYDDTLDTQSATDESETYDTASSSLSFHSTCSPSTSSKISDPDSAKPTTNSGHRKALANKAQNIKGREVVESQRASRPVKSVSNATPKDAASIATPKARRVNAKRVAADSPQTLRKAASSKASESARNPPVSLPNESTPPPSQPAGRARRQAAQAARMAIEDYDFADRDMTPRRPVPTKSYIVEKVRQLAELADQEEHGRLETKAQAAISDRTSGGLGSDEAVANSANKSRKSMAARPRHTTAPRLILSPAIAVSDSSLSSVNDIGDLSYEDRSTSQSSFSLIIPSCDESYDPPPRRPAASASHAKQNKRVTRRIAASSDDEEEDADKAGGASDDEIEQDSTSKLAAQVAELAVADAVDASASDIHLSELLASVSQTKPNSFADVIQRLRASTGSSRATNSRRRLEKIGEASYSEVFKIFAASQFVSSAKSSQQEALVLKIIPITSPKSSNSSRNAEDLPYMSHAADVDREIRLMQLIGSGSTQTGSFVSLHAAHIVRGAYPAALLQAWDRWDAKRRAKTGEGAENIRPHVLGRQQVYALLVMTDGGTDLESLKVKSWLQAASIFWQVAAGLGEMESRYEFEHRDLHWGNILVQTVTRHSSAPTASERPRRGSSARSRSSSGDGSNPPSWLLNPEISGLKATIIDFTLSRSSTSQTTNGRGENSKILYYPFDDETLFEGSGDSQFEVYREMRIATKGEWQKYCPSTNVLWLRYLAHKLIDIKCKTCKAPKPLSASANLDEQREMQAYTALKIAADRLDSAARKELDDVTETRQASKRATAARKSLHPRSRTSVIPTAAGRARKARSTMAATSLLRAEAEDDETMVRSAAELMLLINEG